MEPNTHSSDRPISQSTRHPDQLASLAAAVEELAAQDLDGLSDAALAERVLRLRRLLDGLEGHWLHQLAAVDGRGAAGADHGCRRAPPPAGWATGCAWGPARPAAVSGPLGRCSGGP